MRLFTRNFISALKNIFLQNKQVFGLVAVLLDWLSTALRVEDLGSEKSDTEFLRVEDYKFTLCKGLYWSLIDFLLVYLLSNRFFYKNQNSVNFFVTKKTEQLYNNKFLLFNNSDTTLGNKQLFLYGLQSIWSHIRMWVLPITIITLFVYYSFFIKSLPFSKVFFSYILLGNMFYLLISGFVFFFKKYQYRLYTSAIQRF
jgi:hypothetical protein